MFMFSNDNDGLAFLLGSLVGVVVTVIAAATALDEGSSGEQHHRNAYDAHGNLTCEFCKALVEKGRDKNDK